MYNCIFVNKPFKPVVIVEGELRQLSFYNGTKCFGLWSSEARMYILFPQGGSEIKFTEL